jgi:sodium-independent sulfate anion transporter 11
LTLQDRPWNNAGPRKIEELEADANKPILKAVILDFSSVNNVDVTAIQVLIDVRNQLDKYAAPETVDWHFAHVENRWTKRALAAAGFGYKTPTTDPAEGPGHWKAIFSIADLGGSESAEKAAAIEEREELKASHKYDIERAGSDEITPSDKDVPPKNPGSHRLVAVHGLNRPYFHFDLQEAVEAAVENAERKAY